MKSYYKGFVFKRKEDDKGFKWVDIYHKDGSYFDSTVATRTSNYNGLIENAKQMIDSEVF
jgi:hypothetical protein